MNAAKNRLACPIACALVALAVGLSSAAARPIARDDLYRSARLDTHPLTTVALLPAVAVADDPGAERLVEFQWVALYGEGTTTWMPADQVRARLALAAGELGDLAREVNEQVWRRGEVEPRMAGRLAQLLGVDAVLSLRIDRWEIADGGRATVEMTAALTHADGTRLWSISGLAGYGHSIRSAEQSFNMDMSWIRRSYLEPQGQDHKLGHALYGLLARWAWSLPAPLYARAVADDASPAEAFAGNQREAERVREPGAGPTPRPNVE
jgi:hypothetical protein